MLEDIKSQYLIQNIFSFVNQTRIFELVKYNKNLQNNFNINLIDYKNLSGKYIIYEGNRKGKEYYFNGKLRFEGEYVNGNRWNGKGYNVNNNNFYELKEGTGHAKEYNYYDGKLVFEGDI